MSQFAPTAIIGKGPLGGKSAEMVKLGSRIGDMCIRLPEKSFQLKMPSFLPITPLLCEEIASKAGCGKNDTPESAKEKLLNAKNPVFDTSMLQLYQMCAEARQDSTILYAIRSDDVGFTGIMPTLFIKASFKDQASMINRLKNAVASVIAGRYSDDAKAAASLLPFWSDGGVMAMPFYGEEYGTPLNSPPGASYDYHVAPPLTASYISPSQTSDYNFFRVFRGISMCPSPENMKKIGVSESFSTTSYYSDPNAVTTLVALVYSLESSHPLGLNCRKEYPTPVFFNNMVPLELGSSVISISVGIDSAMQRLKREFKKVYVELLCPDGRNPFEWLFMQFSSLDFISQERPKELPSDEKWAHASSVMGFADKTCCKVHFAGPVPQEADREFNMANKNYLLVLQVYRAWDFHDNWHLPDFGNAGAIALITRDAEWPVVSHMGGIMRMLGTPILAYDVDINGAQVEKLMNLPRDSSCRIIADESVSEGGITAV